MYYISKLFRSNSSKSANPSDQTQEQNFVVKLHQENTGKESTIIYKGIKLKLIESSDETKKVIGFTEGISSAFIDIVSVGLEEGKQQVLEDEGGGGDLVVVSDVILITY